MKKAKLKQARISEIEKRNAAKVNSIIYPSDVDEKYTEKNAYIIIRNLNKIYDNDVQAVFDFNLNINKNEFIVLVGPSGCGKSTTLRMICGLENITNGELYINRVYTNELAPKDRDIAMVFQSYALYPHMSVFDNMAFGLKIKKVPVPVFDKNGNPVMHIDHKLIRDLKKKEKGFLYVQKESEKDIRSYEAEMAKLESMKGLNTPEINDEKIANRLCILQEKKEYDLNRIERAEKEIAYLEEQIEKAKNTEVQKTVLRHLKKAEIEEKVNRAAEILEITQYLNRKPKALSGGQRQRVALGRAIVRNAAAFLMDEPLSNLDAKLRVQMRAEIVKLHRQIEATTIYVTHDQTEAMTMADRIVVMNEGIVQQIGSPRTIYEKPVNLFVATFIGAPAMNVLPARVENNRVVLTENNSVNLLPEQLEQTKNFLNSEIERLNNVDALLDNALKDEEDKRHDVYLMAKQRIADILADYNEKLNGTYDVNFGVRPEDMSICDNDDPEGIEIVVSVVELLGSEYYIHSSINGQNIVIKLSSNLKINVNDKIKVKVNMEKAHVFDKFTDRAMF